jgi:hypothetical protein
MIDKDKEKFDKLVELENKSIQTICNTWNCKYVFTNKRDDDYNKIPDIGDEEPIELKFTHTDIEINNPRKCESGDYSYKSNLKVDLYACPKCKIVIFN